jgi:hypothetical protein
MDAASSFAELVKVFREFIFRDLIYLGGGVTVLLSLAHALFDIRKLYYKSLPKWLLFYFCFLSWVVGYATLEAFSLIGLVTTSDIKPGPITGWLLTQWDGSIKLEEWTQMDRPLRPTLRRCLYFLSAEQRGFVLRITDLKTLGSTIGACMLLSGAILLTSVVRKCSRSRTVRRYGSPPRRGEIQARAHLRTEAALATVATAFGIILVVMGRLQSFQETRYLAEFVKKEPKCEINTVLYQQFLQE